MRGFRPAVKEMDATLRLTVDILTAAGLGILGLLSDESIYGGPNKRGFFRGQESISFPMSTAGESVSTGELIIYCVLVPVVLLPIIDILALRDGGNAYKNASWKDVAKGVTLRLATFVVGCGLTVFLTAIAKDTVGSLRPDFLARCDPDYSLVPANQTWIPGSLAICRGDAAVVTKGRRSFPSGHSSVAFFAWIYVALFVQRAIPNHRRCCSYLLTCLQLPMIAVAFLITASRTVDNVHRPADVISGALLGICIAVYCVFVLLAPHMAEKEHRPAPSDRLSWRADDDVVNVGGTKDLELAPV